MFRKINILVKIMNPSRIAALCLLALLFSCESKNTGAENAPQTITPEESPANNNIEMAHPIEYYQNEIIKYQDNYYGFEKLSMKITDMMNISSITKVDDIIDRRLTFFVSWFNPKGYVYYMYSFDSEQKIAEHYYCGDFVPFGNHRKLTEKLGGIIPEYGDVSIGDFNSDGKNEIALYSFYKNIGNVFLVYGFNETENKLEELCRVPVFINFENPFPSAQYTGNGFKILEIIDEALLELSWNEYLWGKDTMKYTKQ